MAEQQASTPSAKRRWVKPLGWAMAIILVPLILGAVFLVTPIGKRVIADQIAQAAPASGLRFEVGRIEGDLYNDAVLHDVTLKDPNGAFLKIPEVELNWRPLAWLWSGLDIRELSARRGTLTRLPELLPGDPDAPLLPAYDIRIDKFEIENLTLAEGLAGTAEQRVDVLGNVDIRSGKALVQAEGRFGPEDQIKLLLDAEPDGDRFDLALDYNASSDGPIAALAGFEVAYEAKVEGEGTWQNWSGAALVKREQSNGSKARVAGFLLNNNAGNLDLIGQSNTNFGAGTLLGRATGETVSLVISGTLEESVFDGAVRAVGAGLDLDGDGIVNLADNAVQGFAVKGEVLDPELLGGGIRLDRASFSALLDGAFTDLSGRHQVSVGTLDIASVAKFQELSQSGILTFDGETLSVPLAMSLASLDTGYAFANPHLTDGRLNGLLTYADGKLNVDQAQLAFANVSAEMSLRGDTKSGVYALAGPINARRVELENVGKLTVNAKVLATFGSVPWSVNANLSGVVNDVANASVANVAGEQVRFDAKLGLGSGRTTVLRDVRVGSERLYASLDSQIIGSRTSFTGTGEHIDYGSFEFDADLSQDGPVAQFVFADPFPAARLSDVRIGVAPSEDGFALDVAGGSLLGAFEGQFGLVLPANASTQIEIDRLQIYRTNVTGGLELSDNGVSGDLQLNGGGLSGTARISSGEGERQDFAVDLTASQARFGGDTVIALRFADIDMRGSFGGGSTTINADVKGRGLEYGALSLANFEAQAQIIDGQGDLKASIAGRRAERFRLELEGAFSEERIALIADGEYAGAAITMPRRAVMTALADGGYRLAPTQIGYSGGFTILEGTLGGENTAIQAQLARMPLRLADLVGADLGLGGRVSGLVSWKQSGAAMPSGEARIRVDRFSRSGLVLSSRPVDLVAVAELSGDELTVGARLLEDDGQLGRVTARISDLSQSGDLTSRIMRGKLNAEIAYDGPAQTLWRLTAIETFDLTGPVSVTARAGNTLSNPRMRGDLSGENLRLQSAISGTDIEDLSARGRFAGSRLELTRFSGSTDGSGSVSGSGTIDFAGLSSVRGPRIDIRAAANRARLLNANGLDARITGPLRIVSNGIGGAIAGRVEIDRASWGLGVAEDDLRLPIIATREINLPDDLGEVQSSAAGSWRYLVDARARNGVAVDGLGLDSEWGVDIALRGTVQDPRIGGEARLVRGDYTFAGTRFELSQGRISFDEDGPIDPRLAIEAEASANGTDVTIDITGNAQSPEIAFSSTPQLPQEEILAQLLFGGSVTSLSATDAVQLGAALAALQGGDSGIDPIGTLRRSIGLDQLRIVSADPALGRETGVALGKNIGRKIYVELVTDGQGYSATQVEYRITRWLALLGTVTTVGRDSVLAEVSRDY